MVLTLLFERCQGHHHREGEAETSTRDQVLEKLDSVEEFKAFSSSLKEPAEYNKLVSTLQNFNDVLFVFNSGRMVSKRIISCSIERVLLY